MQTTRMMKVMAAALALGACGGDDGNKPNPDGPTHDAPPDTGGPATKTINGTGRQYAVTAAGVVDAPIDFTGVQFASYSTIGGALTRSAGAGNADGTFSVPVGADATSWEISYTASGAPAYLVQSSSAAPDFRRYQLGRLGAALPTAETDVELNLTGMSPWGAADTFEVLSPENGAILFSPEYYVSTYPNPGDTTFDQVLDWSLFQAPLVDAAAGDSVKVFQLATQGTGATQYAALARLGVSTAFTQVSGQQATLPLALAPVALNKSFALHWKRSQFEALGVQVAPTNPGASGTQFFAIDALPHLGEYGFFASAPDLALMYPSGATDLDATLNYSNPFLTGATPWDEFAIIGYYFNVPVALGSSAPETEQAGLYAYVSLASLAGGVVTPTLSPVRNVMLGGKSLATAQTGVGTAPLLTWDAPSTGTATSYFVQLKTLSSTAQGTSARVTAQFRTTTTSVQIPSTFLVGGATYVLVVTAEASPGYDASVTPFTTPMPYASAIAVTATFQP